MTTPTEKVYEKSSTRPWIIAGVVVIVVGFVGWWGVTQVSKPTTGDAQTVIMKDDRFEPSTLTIKKNTKVIFKNEGTKSAWPASGPHPTHSIYPEFDPQKAIEPGQEWSFVFEKVGSWHYHNHFNEEVAGVINVVEVASSTESTPAPTAKSSGASGNASLPVASDFTLPSTSGGSVTLSDFRGKKNVLLYFNEGLSCDPCMQQVPELEKNMADFQRMNVEVFAVMLDSVDQLKQAESQYGIKQIPMLSYANAKTEQDYNLLPFSMGMGRRAGHTFVLVGEDGKILWRRDYWPGYGMMIAGGSMFIESKYIVQAVQEHLNLQ